MNTVRLPALNRVTLAGRLTRDPEVRYTPAGHAVATHAMAVNRSFRDASGAWQEETCFVPVVATVTTPAQARNHSHGCDSLSISAYAPNAVAQTTA